MKYSLLLSFEAEQDILTVLEYTEEKWGIDKVDSYAASLEEGLKHITQHPYIERSRSDISPKHRSFMIEKHVAVYFIEGETVHVSRLFHYSQDMARYSFE